MYEFQKQENEVKGATFTPAVNTANFPLQNFRPIQDRYKEIQQHKDELLLSLKRKFEDKANLTFKPSLDKVTERLAIQKNQGKPVIDRIAEAAEDIAIRKMVQVQLEERRVADECTFQPNVDNYMNDDVGHR